MNCTFNEYYEIKNDMSKHILEIFSKHQLSLFVSFRYKFRTKNQSRRDDARCGSCRDCRQAPI